MTDGYQEPTPRQDTAWQPPGEQTPPEHRDASATTEMPSAQPQSAESSNADQHNSEQYSPEQYHPESAEQHAAARQNGHVEEDPGRYLDQQGGHGYGEQQGFQPPYEQPQYEQPQYEQPQYEQPQYEQPQYDPAQYQQVQYEQAHYEQAQHGQPHQGQPQYDPAQYEQAQYEQAQYDPAQYEQAQQYAPQQYGQQPGYDQPQYAQQHEQVQYEQPQQYAQPASFEVEQTQSGPFPGQQPQPFQQPGYAAAPQPGYPAQYPAGMPPGQPQPHAQQAPPPGPAPSPYPQPGYPPQPPASPYATQGPPPHAQPTDLARQAAQAVQDLSSAQLLRNSKRAPQSGWRKAVYLASARTLNLGESPADVQRRELITRINQPLRGCYKIAMLSLKGGVGKTTTTTTLGSTFASLRGDRVIAVDANPDRGTLSQKIPLETTATVRHLLRDANRITRYSDVRSYTSQGPSRLEVLASEQDPAVSEAFSESDYRRTIDLLEHFYNIVLTDCGTGLMHSAMKGVLDIADSLVIVSSSSIDGARSASATLDWLDAHGYRDLVGRSVAVINSVRQKSGKVNLSRVSEHFAARCRAVCEIPFDPHLEEGAEVDLEQLASPTRLALLDLAATVADDFPHEAGRR